MSIRPDAFRAPDTTAYGATTNNSLVGWRRLGETIDEFCARVGVTGADLVRLNPEYFATTKRPDSNQYELGTWVRLRLSDNAPPESTLRPGGRTDEPDRQVAPAQPRLGFWARLFGGGSQRDPNPLNGAFGGTGQPTRIPGITAPAAYQQHIDAVANRVRDRLASVGVSAQDFTALMQRVMYFESSFDPNATSRVGARGLMQLMPDTAAEVARTHGVRFSPGMIADPATNIELGGLYLADMLVRFGGRFDLAAAAYNAGPNRASLRAGFVPQIAETQAYVRKVVPTSVA